MPPLNRRSGGNGQQFTSNNNNRQPFYPPSDKNTYKDLNLFEERLRINAAALYRRKHRYQLFLGQLVCIIAFLCCEVFLNTSFMDVPYNLLMRALFPNLYRGLQEKESISARRHFESSSVEPQQSPTFSHESGRTRPDLFPLPLQLHPYIASGLLTVAVTTLVLFFATGLYAEKIGYANRYVPHANRALRNFNMYFNVRNRPLRSRLALLNPFRSSRDPSSPPPTPLTLRRSLLPSPRDAGSRSSSPSSLLTIPTPSASTSSRSEDPIPIPLSPTTGTPILPIPPASNPRGELIFTSRVHPGFQEGYGRYRALFQKKREEEEERKRREEGGIRIFGLALLPGLRWIYPQFRLEEQAQEPLNRQLRHLREDGHRDSDGDGDDRPGAPS